MSSEKTDARILAHKECKSDREAGARVGLSPSGFRAWRKRNNLPPIQPVGGSRSTMVRIDARIPKFIDEKINEIAEKNRITKSETIRLLLSKTIRGMIAEQVMNSAF